MLIRWGAATLLVAVVSACGDDAGSTADEPDSTPRQTDPVAESAAATSIDPGPSTPEPSTTTGPTRRGTTVATADSEFGTMLFDGNGRAIYLFDAETTSTPECYGACAEAWPPVLTADEPVAGRGVNGALLDTTERRDGTVQVTYNGHPLYLYAHEAKGEVKCHDVFLNGGNWYVVQPDGAPAPPG